MTEWYKEELDLWRSALKTRREDIFWDYFSKHWFALLIPFIGPCTFQIEEHANAVLDFETFGGKPNYKGIDFNYADQPDREGECPSPRCTKDTGEMLTPSDYTYRIGLHSLEKGGDEEGLEPHEVCCGGSVTLCGKCIHRTDLGNLWLGYAGYYYLLSYAEVLAGGTVFAPKWRENPWKEASWNLGYRFAAESGDQAEGLCTFLQREGMEQMTDPCFAGKEPCSVPLHSGFKNMEPAAYFSGADWDDTWGPELHKRAGHFGPDPEDCTGDPAWCQAP